MRSARLAICAFLLGTQAAPPPSQKKKSPANNDHSSSALAQALPVAPASSGSDLSNSGADSSSVAKGNLNGKGRLVIHVGPHKTGTSSTQFFLVQHVAWLNATFGIQVAGGRDPGKSKMACYLPNTIMHRDDVQRAKASHNNPVVAAPMANARFVSERIYQTIVDDIAAWCSKGATVLVSSEDFSGLTTDQWQPLLKLCPEVTMVMAHRDEASWAKSMWSFDEPADHPQSFGSFLANERPRRWAQGVDLLNRLELVVGSTNVVGVSYELLLEEDVAMECFLVCNATLQLQGKAYTTCLTAFAGFKKVHHNPSPADESLVLDMRRLLRAVWLSRPLSCFDEHASTARSKPRVVAASSTGSMGTALTTTTIAHAGTAAAKAKSSRPLRRNLSSQVVHSHRTKALPAQTLPPVRDSAIVAVAEQLPLTCANPPALHANSAPPVPSSDSSRSSSEAGNSRSDSSSGDGSSGSSVSSSSSLSVLEAMSQSSSAEWYRRTGVRAPTKQPHQPVPICLINEGALTREHWVRITALLPPCLGMGI